MFNYTDELYPEFQQSDEKFPEEHYTGPGWVAYLILAVAVAILCAYYLIRGK